MRLRLHILLAEQQRIWPELSQSLTVDWHGVIGVLFFGGLRIARVGKPERCEDNHVYIASLLDLAVTVSKST